MFLNFFVGSNVSATHKIKSNERLEFLGDTVLNLAISERLFRYKPYISEGDTPAFLYSLANGLRSHEDPTFGGWGGCFYKVEGFERVYRDTGFGQLREWVEPAMHDFQARLEWCITPEYNKANHKPIIEVPMGLDHVVTSGDTIRLEAVITDPDPFDVDAVWLSRGDMWAQKGITKEMVAANPQRYHTPWRSGWYQYPTGTYRNFIDLYIQIYHYILVLIHILLYLTYYVFDYKYYYQYIGYLFFDQLSTSLNRQIYQYSKIFYNKCNIFF